MFAVAVVVNPIAGHPLTAAAAAASGKQREAVVHNLSTKRFVAGAAPSSSSLEHVEPDGARYPH